MQEYSYVWHGPMMPIKYFPNTSGNILEMHNTFRMMNKSIMKCSIAKCNLKAKSDRKHYMEKMKAKPNCWFTKHHGFIWLEYVLKFSVVRSDAPRSGEESWRIAIFDHTMKYSLSSSWWNSFHIFPQLAQCLSFSCSLISHVLSLSLSLGSYLFFGFEKWVCVSRFQTVAHAFTKTT